MKRKIGRKWAGAVFLVPSLLGVLLFVILPFGDVVRRSFMTAVTKEAAGGKNYKIVFTNSAFLLAVKNTLKFTLVCIPLMVALGLAIALAMGSIRHMQAVKSLYLFPLAMPTAAVAVVWKMVFYEKGFLNKYLEQFGIGGGVDYIGSGAAFYVLAGTYIWKNLGYTIVLWLAGIMGVNGDMMEAARVDGASTWRTYWSIIFPVMRPMHATVAVITALAVWNDKLTEIWQLVTQSPQTFRGGAIWQMVMNIHGALQAVGYALLVLFFVVGVVKTCGSFAEVKRPEHALRLFVRFALAKGVITYGMDLMLALLEIVQGIVSSIMNAAGLGGPQTSVLPGEIVTAIEDCSFLGSIPLWAVTLIGGLFIWVLSFVMILSVYGRFFKLYLYAAIAPIPLASFAGEPSQNIGRSFLKSYAAVCLEGAVIVLACAIFDLFAGSPPNVNAGAAAASMVWSYIGELVFNMLILVGAVKMADRVVREMMGL